MISDSDLADILALYDHDERFTATYSDTRREEVASLVRHVDLVGQEGAVIYSRLNEVDADAAIVEQVAYFQGLGQGFEWKTYGHDRPVDLVQRLKARGFAVEEEEAILVIDAQSAPTALLSPSAVEIRRVEQPEQLQDISSIRQRVYGKDDRVARLAYELARDLTRLSVYLAYVDDVAAACGWTNFPTDSAFASLWGGSTVPELRGRGMYTSLVGARVREARQRGARYVTVDARHMSRPILERLGFQYLTSSIPCIWSPPAG
jgi:GNAT superfamily N-acetyltransferase